MAERGEGFLKTVKRNPYALSSPRPLELKGDWEIVMEARRQAGRARAAVRGTPWPSAELKRDRKDTQL
jgi:hypothetical protein